MSKMRERMIGAGVTVVVAGGAFWGITAANADEAPPAATTEATIASLTARLVAAEWEIYVHGLGIQGLNDRVMALENP